MDISCKKILIDTNILISSIVFGGKVNKVLVELINRKCKIFVTQYIDHEFRDKIIEKWPNDFRIYLKKYEELMIPIYESCMLDIIKVNDVKDIPIVSDAIYFKIDILLTGDKELFKVKPIINVMSVEEIYAILFNQNR